MNIKPLLILFVASIANLLLAGDVEFMKAYDAGTYDSAAKLLRNVDMDNPEVLCRVGTMYYSGLGIASDREKGRQLLWKAMEVGNASAAIKLAKIFFNKENNPGSAAYCLMLAEEMGSSTIKDEAKKLRARFGNDYQKGLEFYIKQEKSLQKERMNLWSKEKASFEDADSKNKAMLQSAKDKLHEAEVMISTLQKEVDTLKEDNTKLVYELTEAQCGYDAEIKKRDKQEKELKQKYEMFVKNEYNPLVTNKAKLENDYNKLHDEFEALNIAHQELVDSIAKDDSEGSFFLVGMGRGVGTLLMAPLNYVRGLTYVQHVSHEWESDGAESGLAKIFALPMIVFETLPMCADIVDGAVDITSFGYYGDWLYKDGKNSPWWFDRDDEVFPWITRKTEKR